MQDASNNRIHTIVIIAPKAPYVGEIPDKRPEIAKSMKNIKSRNFGEF